MRKPFILSLLLLGLAVAASAQSVRITGGGASSVKELAGSGTLVSIILKGSGAKDSNLRIVSVSDGAINVATEKGDSYPYLISDIAEVQVQGTRVQADRYVMPDRAALREKDLEIVNRAWARLLEIYDSSQDNQELRIAAAAALATRSDLGDANPLQYLEKMMESGDLVTELDAGFEMFLSGHPVPEKLLRFGLESGNRTLRSRAANLAGLTGFEPAVPILSEMLQDRVDELSSAAARALARLGVREIIPQLLTMILEGSTLKSDAAVFALTELGGEDVIEQMRIMVDSAEGMARFRIARVLFALGDSVGQRELKRVMVEMPTLALDAAIDLASVEDFDALQYLRQRLQRKEDPTEPNLINRARIASGLIRGGDPSAMVILLELLRSENLAVRLRVCELSVELGSRKLLEVLNPSIENVDNELSLAACQATISFQDHQYRERLIESRR